MSSEICNIFQRGNHSAPVTCSMLCESRCCYSSPQEKFRVESSHSLLACATDGWFARGKSERKLLMAKWRLRWNWNEAAGENSGNAAFSWEMGNHGDSQGSCGHSVWQSGHNTGLIHHMGINAASRYDHWEILHCFPRSNRKKNSPLPHKAKRCLLGKRRAKWTGIIDLKEKKRQHLS